MISRAAPVQRVAFGSSQERKVFPLHFAPDRLGNLVPGQRAPHLGPGSYDNHEVGTMLYNLEKTPGSKRGYGLSARTAARFPPSNELLTPLPWTDQQDQTGFRAVPSRKTSFNSTAQRFRIVPCTADDTPGPGKYAQHAGTNQKVSWPMCFGSPDWSSLPQLEKKSLRVKLGKEKEFLKHRTRVAYLSLYF